MSAFHELVWVELAFNFELGSFLAAVAAAARAMMERKVFENKFHSQMKIICRMS